MPVETTVMYKPSVADPGQEKCSQVIFWYFNLFLFLANQSTSLHKQISVGFPPAKGSELPFRNNEERVFKNKNQESGFGIAICNAHHQNYF